jgi:Transglycosylase SLT domain
MSLEIFVRASGAVMGLARDSFSLGQAGGSGSATGPLSTPTAAAVSGSGQAVSAFNNESGVMVGQLSALGEQDLAASSDLTSALAAAGAGHDQMQTVIAGAVGDINRLAAATTTPAGRQALLTALTARLEQTWQTLTNGNADASTRAASSTQTAAAYSAVGTTSGTVAAPTAATTAAHSTSAASASTQNTAMSAATMAAANQAVLSEATQLASLQQLPTTAQPTTTHAATLANSVTSKGKPASAIPISSLQYDRHTNVASGKTAATNYINQTLNLMGITDKTARSNWMNGLLVGMYRESTWLPWAVNDYDSNAVGPPVADGFPAGCSRGLMQTIPAVFAANHQPGTSDNVYDPIANTAAGMNYLISRYHVLRDGSNLGAVNQFNPIDAPTGY